MSKIEKYDWFVEQEKLHKLMLREELAKKKLDSQMMEKLIISCLKLLSLKQLEDLRYLITQKIKRRKIFRRIQKNENKR